MKTKPLQAVHRPVASGEFTRSAALHLFSLAGACRISPRIGGRIDAVCVLFHQRVLVVRALDAIAWLQAALHDGAGKEFDVVAFLDINPAIGLITHAAHFAFKNFFGILRATL